MGDATGVVDVLQRVGWSAVELDEPGRALVAAAYSAWRSAFTRGEARGYPADYATPAGFHPLCRGGGAWELKESFYLRAACEGPPRTREVTGELLRLLASVAIAVAEEVNGRTGSEVVHLPGSGCLRVMRYPAFLGDADSGALRALAASGQLRTVPHLDLNALTVLTPATAPGLEVRCADGWAAVDERRALLVQGGQELAARSGQRWPAVEHRVRNPTAREAGVERMSCAYFVT